MSPLEKKDRRLGEGKRISKKKNLTVRGGKIDFQLRGKEKTFKNLPVESGILGFRVRSTAQRICIPPSYWNSTDKDWNRVPRIRNP